MKRKFRRNLKGISTIIATIIIVAIAIVMAIAAAYWALGIGGSFTRFEKLQYTSAPYATFSSGTYTIYINLKNSGSAPASIDANSTMINGQPVSSYSANATFLNSGAVPIGSSTSGTIKVAAGEHAGTTFASGTTLAVTIQTSAGNSYPNTVTLP